MPDNGVPMKWNCRLRIRKTVTPRTDYHSLALQYIEAAECTGTLCELAERWNVTDVTLKAFGVGWCEE